MSRSSAHSIAGGRVLIYLYRSLPVTILCGALVPTARIIRGGRQHPSIRRMSYSGAEVRRCHQSRVNKRTSLLPRRCLLFNKSLRAASG